MKTFLNDADRLAFHAVSPEHSLDIQEFKKHYLKGKMSLREQFGRDFATSCVEHTIANIEEQKGTIACLITEAKNLYQGLKHLAIDHFEFGVNAFKDLLILNSFPTYHQTIEIDEGITIKNSLNIDMAANITFKNKEQEEAFFVTMFQPLTGKTMILNNEQNIKPISYSIKI